MTERPGCEEVRELVPELATGVADGDARAHALTHLAGCADCRRELEETTRVVDDLVRLAPEHQPSAGFETAVLAAFGARRGGRRLAAAAVGLAACVLAAALGGGLVWWQTADDRDLAEDYRATLAEADGRYLATADLRTAVEPDAGHAFAYEGSPSWVWLTIDDAPSSGTYQVQVVTTEGRTVDVGECEIRDGKGSWGWTLRVPVSEIARVQLLRSGVPTMSADFRT